MLLNLPDMNEDIDWESEETVEAIHYPRLVAAAQRAIPGAHCIALRHQVSATCLDAHLGKRFHQGGSTFPYEKAF